MKKILALLLTFVMCFAFAACGNNAGKNADYTKSVDGAKIVAEAGSAGEELTASDEFFKGAEFTPVDSMAKALMEVAAGTADIALVDSVCAYGMVGEGTDFADLKMVEGVELATEEYGIAFRKDSDFTAKVDKVIKELVADGTLPALAEQYGLALAPAIAG